MTSPLPGANDRPPGGWLFGWRPSPKLAGLVWAAARVPAAVTRGRRWPVAAVVAGVVPLLLGYALGVWQFQFLVGALVAVLLLPTVTEDQFAKAVGIVTVAMGSHSAAAIALSAHDPSGISAALRGSSDYWEQTWRWVRLGEDREYASGIWLPTHLLLLIAVPVTAYTSFGVLPLARGVQEVDLMNYYVGQLVRVGDSSAVAVLLGWHPWSFVRGLAYTVLVYEMMSLSLERFTGRRLSTRRRRMTRLAVGVALAVLDGGVKYLLAPTIREALFANVRPEFAAADLP